MPSSFDSVNTQVDIEEHQIAFFSDTIAGLRQTIEGLAQLAGLEGLDAVSLKLQEAVEECEIALSLSQKGDNVHQASYE